MSLWCHHPPSKGCAIFTGWPICSDKLGLVDFDFCCSTFFRVLLGWYEISKKWVSKCAIWRNIKDQSQTNPHSLPPVGVFLLGVLLLFTHYSPNSRCTPTLTGKQKNRPSARGSISKCEIEQDASAKIDEDSIWGKVRIGERADSDKLSKSRVVEVSKIMVHSNEIALTACFDYFWNVE